MSENLRVKKLVWENAAELNTNPNNVFSDYIQWIKQAVIVSTIRSSEFNTTDKFIEIWEAVKAGESIWEIKTKLMRIRKFYFSIIDKEFPWDKQNLKDYLDIFFQKLVFDIFYLYQEQDKKITSKENDSSISINKWFTSIVWFWEELSAYIYEKIFSLNWVNAKVIDLNWIVPENSEELKESELFEALSSQISLRVDEVLKQWRVPIIPAYIPWFTNDTENTISLVNSWLSSCYEISK